MRLFLSPTLLLSVRGPDDYALTGGGFGANRTHGGKNEPHPGLDLISPPKSPIVMPCSGPIVHVGPAYANDLRYSWIRIRPEGLHDVEIVVGYVRPLTPIGRLAMGDPLGSTEDLSGRYPDPDGDGPKKSIVNHVHFEIRVGGVPIDPLPWLRESLKEV